MIIGIICGLGAALCQCISYIFSKNYIHKHGNSFQLLIASHIIMGVFAAVCLALLSIYNDFPPLKEYWLELLAVNGFYVFGQMSFFGAISRTEASRLAPLLGLKIIFIAIFGIMFLENHLSLWQWFAVALCFCGAILSNWSGKRVPWPAVLWILGAVAGYSMSDIFVKKMINCIVGESSMKIWIAVFITANLSYFYIGIVSLLIIFLVPSIKVKHLRPAVKFSCCWFAALLFLFTCFGFIGPLFGNIVQSGRGVMAVVIGAAMAHFGWSVYEEKLSRMLLVRRISAALLITISIIVFALGRN